MPLTIRAAPLTVWLKIVPRTLKDEGNPSDEFSIALDNPLEAPSLDITINSTDYYKFTASWPAEAGDDWMVVQWKKSTQSWDEALPGEWVRYSDGSAVLASSFGGAANFRAWRVRVVNGKQVMTEVSTTVNETINRWPAPTGVEVMMNYASLPSDQTEVEWMIPTGFKGTVSEVQIWDNTDIQVANTVDSLKAKKTELDSKFGFPQDYWSLGGQWGGESWPTISVRYIKDGLPSEYAMVNFTMPTVTGIYYFT